MSRASSRRVAIESIKPRIVVGEIAVRPARSPKMVAIGASSTGGRATASPGSARRKPFTHRTSGNSRMTWRNESRIPITSTAMMSAFRPGLAMKATTICLCSTTTIRPHRIRNTIIRTSKIRGEDNVKGSRSRAMVRAFPCTSLKVATHESPAMMAQKRQQHSGGAPSPADASTGLFHAIHVVAQDCIDAGLIAAALRLEEIKQVFVELDRDRLLFGLLRIDHFPELVVSAGMVWIAACPFLDLLFGQTIDTVPIGLRLGGT